VGLCAEEVEEHVYGETYEEEEQEIQPVRRVANHLLELVCQSAKLEGAEEPEDDEIGGD
jgi:hypothetical protein